MVTVLPGRAAGSFPFAISVPKGHRSYSIVRTGRKFGFTIGAGFGVHMGNRSRILGGNCQNSAIGRGQYHSPSCFRNSGIGFAASICSYGVENLSREVEKSLAAGDAGVAPTGRLAVWPSGRLSSRLLDSSTPLTSPPARQCPAALGCLPACGGRRRSRPGARCGLAPGRSAPGRRDRSR